MKTRLNRLNQAIAFKNPVKVLQFGTGNFIRASIGWAIHKMNKESNFNGSIAAVQLNSKGCAAQLMAQDGLYSCHLSDESPPEYYTSEIIDDISIALNPYVDFSNYQAILDLPQLRFFTSDLSNVNLDFDSKEVLNDQGLQFSFPAIIAAALYYRFKHFKEDKTKGIIILTCEAIENKSDALEPVVWQYIGSWKLSKKFQIWVRNHCHFCNSFFDRIVGSPTDSQLRVLENKSGYADLVSVVAEYYHFWVIEGDEFIRNELPIDYTNIHAYVVKKLKPYFKLKFYLLNCSLLAISPLLEFLKTKSINGLFSHLMLTTFFQKIIYTELYHEIGIDQEEKDKYISDLNKRLKNPGINIDLVEVGTHSIAKYEKQLIPLIWSFYNRYGKLPPFLCFSLAVLFIKYRGYYKHITFQLFDETKKIEKFNTYWNQVGGQHNYAILVRDILSSKELWQNDLTQIPGLINLIRLYIQSIEEAGLVASLEWLLNGRLSIQKNQLQSME